VQFDKECNVYHAKGKALTLPYQETQTKYKVLIFLPGFSYLWRKEFHMSEDDRREWQARKAEIMELLFNKFMYSNRSPNEHRQVSEMRRRCHSAAFNNILALAGYTQDEFETICMNRCQAGNSVLIPFNENQAELILNAFAFFIVSGVAPAALSDEQKDLINKMLDNFPSLKEKYGFIWP
jgi:hypothetical protein